jgi:hypothetical protein
MERESIRKVGEEAPTPAIQVAIQVHLAVVCLAARFQAVAMVEAGNQKDILI